MISVPGRRRDGDERRERDHRVGRLAADVDVTDVRRLPAVVGLGLDVDPVETSEAVEVVHVGAAHRRRHRLEHLVHGHTERARLLAIELDPDLRIGGIERREERGELGPLPRGRQEVARLGAELLDAQRAAPVLKQEVEARRRAEAGDGRDVERERDRLRNRRQLHRHAAHDAEHVERLAVPLLPRLETHEDTPEVRLVGAGDRAVAADRLERLDAVDLLEHLLDLAEHRARPLERGARRELHVDAEEPLVLVGNEPGRQRATQDRDPRDHHDR